MFATQTNSEVSEDFTFDNFKAPGLGMLILGSDKSTGFESLSHDITGAGFPVASQSNVALPPLTTRWDVGSLLIFGYPGGGLSARDIFEKNIVFY